MTAGHPADSNEMGCIYFFKLSTSGGMRRTPTNRYTARSEGRRLRQTVVLSRESATVAFRARSTSTTHSRTFLTTQLLGLGIVKKQLRVMAAGIKTACRKRRREG
jgi:hypothetical protein